MADETKTALNAAADAAKSGTEAAGNAAKQASTTAVKTSKTAAKAATSTAKASRRATPRRTIKKTAGKRKAASNRATGAMKSAASERTNQVNYDFSKGFAGFGAAPFQTYFADAGERSQEAVRRSQKAVEQLADLNRANVEALVDSGKIAVDGVRSIGQDVVKSSRQGVEQAADAVRALAEAKSPTEFIEAQSEFARASFDRFVAESSRLTESVVKLAGEAFQPLSSRASLNAERINKIVA